MSAVERHQDQRCLEDILEIVVHIFWINAIVFSTLESGYHGFPQITSALHEDFQKLITMQERDVADRIEDVYETRIKLSIMERVKYLTPDMRMAIIMDDRPSQFYREALRVKVIKCSTSRLALAEAERNPGQGPPKHYNWCDSRPAYIGQLGVEIEEHRYQLAVTLEVFSELLRSIQVAVRSACLSDGELQALKLKFQAVNSYYAVAYSAAHGDSGPDQHLINMSSQKWW